MASQTGSIDLTASNSVKLAAEAGWQSDLDSYYTKSEIDVTVGGINSTVSTKVGENEVISSINQSSESVSINANKINLTGAVTISDLASDASTALTDAAETATSYVTELTGEDGIMVHPSDDDDTGVQITSDVDILRDGHIVINVGTQGDTSGNTDAGVTIYDGTANENVRAAFGEVITLGNASDGSAVTIDSDSLDMVHGATEMLHFGYGLGTAASGTANAPYYTVGTRAANSTVGNYSVAEGYLTTASGYASHAEGRVSVASMRSSHAEGDGTTASGYYSHAEGYDTTASGGSSHAEGSDTTASGLYSHSQNYGTIAASPSQTAIGMFNIEDANNAYALIVGNGTHSTIRSNALTVDWDGNVACAGTVTPTYDESTCTIESGATEYNVNACWSNGACCTITLSVNLNSALANGDTVRIATAPSGYRPPYSVIGSCYVTGATAQVMAIMGTGGGITLNNRSGSTIGTGANIYVSFTFAPA